MRKFLLVFSFAAFAFNASAQTAAIEIAADSLPQPVVLYNSKLPSAPTPSDTNHIYRMNYKRAIPFAVVATAANLYATPNLIKNKPELTDAELLALNPQAVRQIDRSALRQNPTNRQDIDVLSDRILTVTQVGALALFLNKNIRKDWKRIGLMYYETAAVTLSLYHFSPIGPLFQNKVRPFAYYSYFSADDRRKGNSRNSLYSGHVANAAASTFFMAKVYTDYHPEFSKGKKLLLYGLAALPPAAIGYLRVKSLFHFPSDCLIGLMVGATTGVLVPEGHRIKSKAGITVGLSPVPNGAGLRLGWTFRSKAEQQRLASTAAATHP